MPAQHLRWLPLLLLAALAASLSGCGDGLVGTSRSSFVTGITETTTVKEDGTYQQILQDGAGHTLTNSGSWRTAQATGIPGVPQDGSYIELDDYVEGSGLKHLPATAAALPHIMMLTRRSDFQSSQTQMSQSRQTTLFWTAVLQLMFFIFWVVEIVDVARREFPSGGAKIGWVLVVVLLGCLGALVYYFFGKSQGELPDRNELLGG